MSRVLVIVHDFPPLGGSASLRWLKFVKYLPRFGWEPVVLTVHADTQYLRDPRLASEIPSAVRVHRVRHLDPRSTERCVDKALWPLHRVGWGKRARWFRTALFEWLYVPDDKISWLAPAVILGQRLLRKESVDTMVTTGSPWTAHLIGLLLRKLTGVPWLADYRDPWTTSSVGRYPTRFHNRLCRWLDAAVVRSADRVVAVSHPLLKQLIGLNQDTNSDKYVVITNGYDPSDFPERPRTSSPNRQRMEIVHAGSLYGPRTPRYFLEALTSLIAAGDISPSSIRATFLGNVATTDFQDHQGARWLCLPGYVPHSEAIQRMQTADLLLLLVSPLHGAGATSGKVFEYMASGVPILALAPKDSTAARITRDTHSGLVCDPGSVQQIRQALKALYRQWEAGELRSEQDTVRVSLYDREKLAATLARELDQMVDTSLN